MRNPPARATKFQHNAVRTIHMVRSGKEKRTTRNTTRTPPPSPATTSMVGPWEQQQICTPTHPAYIMLTSCINSNENDPLSHLSLNNRVGPGQYSTGKPCLNQRSMTTVQKAELLYKSPQSLLFFGFHTVQYYLQLIACGSGGRAWV